jgi:dolichol-phosphate mannosyltransferase
LGVIFFLLGKCFFGQNWPQGFATTTILILMSLALNACFLGIIGEYLARIYRQINVRSITIVEEEL